jgi:ABC-type sugar transport system substrate-binding protein
MNRLKFIVSLTTDDNDYQVEQAASAQQTADRLGVDLQIIYAGNDAITQSQQLLKILQGPVDTRPSGIIFEPVGTGLPQVARVAASAGISWVVLNRDVDYIGELRRNCRAPIFAVTSDHEEIGRIQGKQIAALAPAGGYILYIQGPAGSTAAQQRTDGMIQTKPTNVQVRMLKAQWTEESAYKAISSWLKLSTSREVPISVIAAQDDAMAIGARKALEHEAPVADRDRWLSLPFTGCDGMPGTGQKWVRDGLIAATVVVPANTGQALEMAVQAIRAGSQPPERTMTVPSSLPAISQLSPARAKHAGF